MLGGEIVPVNPPPSARAPPALAFTVFPEHTITVIDFPVGDHPGEKVFTFFAVRDPPIPASSRNRDHIGGSHAGRGNILHWWMEAGLIGAPMHTGSYGGKPMLAAYLLFSLASGSSPIRLFHVHRQMASTPPPQARAPRSHPAIGAPNRDGDPRTAPAPARLGPWGISGLTLAAMAIGILGGGVWDPAISSSSCRASPSRAASSPDRAGGTDHPGRKSRLVEFLRGKTQTIAFKLDLGIWA